MSYQDPSLNDRQKNAMAAKKAMLQKFLAKTEDPGLAERQAERKAIHEARVARQARPHGRSGNHGVVAGRAKGRARCPLCCPQGRQESPPQGILIPAGFDQRSDASDQSRIDQTGARTLFGRYGLGGASIEIQAADIVANSTPALHRVASCHKAQKAHNTPPQRHASADPDGRLDSILR